MSGCPVLESGSIGDQTWTKGVSEGAVGEKSQRVKVGDTSYRWNRIHLRRTMETQAPDIRVCDPVCDDEDKCTIPSPVTNTTVMAEHASEKPSVNESVQQSIRKSNQSSLTARPIWRVDVILDFEKEKEM